MADYFADRIALTTSATKVADAVDGDRVVHASGSSADVWVGFDSTHGRSIVTNNSAMGPFVLPGGEELWAGTWSGTADLHLLITQA